MKASKKLSDNLQAVLVDLIELHLQGKQAHWNIIGKGFRSLHLQLDEIVEAARTFADQVAERMRALDAVPDGRSGIISSSTRLSAFPGGEVSTADALRMITERLDEVVATVREVHDAVEEEDPTSADLLHAILERIEQLAWMVGAESRTARKASVKAAG